MPRTERVVSLDFISTGTVKIRPAMRSQPISNRIVTMRLLRSISDRQWTDEYPIGVFLISHPDGPILFDTGESPLCNTAGYSSTWNPAKMLSQVKIGPSDGIVSQLRSRGIEPKDLQAIVISHLHSDHAGGLKDLAMEAPDLPVYVSRQHWDAYGKRPLYASIQGCTPQHWPKDFSPRMLDSTDRPVGPWKESSQITLDGRVIAVATPGHVPGHVSLVVYGDNSDGSLTTYFLTGDATYGIDLLEKEEPDGINDDPKTALNSIRLIKEFARQSEVVVLPSHDSNTPQLLRDRVVYKPR